MQRVLVTGGAGFIGSHLVDHLVAQGASVVVLDDLSTGRRGNLTAAMGSGRVTLVEGTARDGLLMERLLGQPTDAVFHLAGAAGVQLLADRPVRSVEANLLGTPEVLQAAASRGIPVLVASSSEVYGAGPVPFQEDSPVQPGATCDPRGAYAAAKALGEWLALAHHREHGLPVVVVRLFNTVGPRQRGRYGMVVPRFVGQGLAGEPLTVYGDGSQTRCFADVRDVAPLLMELLMHPDAAGRVVNVGSDREISILALAEATVQATGSTAGIRRIPLAEVFPAGFADPPRRIPDLSRLRSLVGRVPMTPLMATLDEVVAWQHPGQGAAGARR